LTTTVDIYDVSGHTTWKFDVSLNLPPETQQPTTYNEILSSAWQVSIFAVGLAVIEGWMKEIIRDLKKELG